VTLYRDGQSEDMNDYILNNLDDSKNNTISTLHFGDYKQTKVDVNLAGNESSSINYSSQFIASLENIKHIRQKYLKGNSIFDILDKSEDCGYKYNKVPLSHREQTKYTDSKENIKVLNEK
jgi:hypothetical protein